MYSLQESAKRLKQLRKTKNVTQEHVAIRLGVSIDTVRKNEQGVRGLSVDMADMYAGYYGTTIDYIINGKQEVDKEIMRLLEGCSVEIRKVLLGVVKGVIEGMGEKMDSFDNVVTK